MPLGIGILAYSQIFLSGLYYSAFESKGLRKGALTSSEVQKIFRHRDFFTETA